MLRLELDDPILFWVFFPCVGLFDCFDELLIFTLPVCSLAVLEVNSNLYCKLENDVCFETNYFEIFSNKFDE